MLPTPERRTAALTATRSTPEKQRREQTATQRVVRHPTRDQPTALSTPPNGEGADDAADMDAAEAGEGACSTWRFWITAPAKGVEVTAPGYQWGRTADAPMVSSCCYSFAGVPVVDRSVVLQPLPACPADWGPCSRDAGLRGGPTSCICP
jgi:hypothetical protein